MMDRARFKALPIMGIMRGIEASAIEPLIETVVASGLETIEITMNTPDADELIRQATALAGDRLMIGAGTVLTRPELMSALRAGAQFVVTPVLVPEVAEYCAKEEIPVFSGALTPLEVYNAWNAGATMVKVFPSGVFGPSYFKELKGPFSQIELLACGGVTPDNMMGYFSSGASAIAFGSSVFKKEWLANKDFASVERSIKAFVVNYPRGEYAAR